MLAGRGHTVLDSGEEPGPEDAVWVVDAADRPTVESFLAGEESSLPRAAVVLADDAGIVGQLARAGLSGWAALSRDSGPVELDLAVRAAEAGFALMELATAAQTLRVVPAPPVQRGEASEWLTPRELQVLQLVAQGLPNKGIARRLGITENTAKFHVASLSTKLGASGRTEAVTRAARRGLIVL